MIGRYNPGALITYLSVASAIAGIGFAFNGNPIASILCLMLSGLLDMFDGKVARMKKNRTEQDVSYGTQIDSLADVIAFGVLPVAIGFSIGMTDWFYWPIGVIFVLAALIRLATFNVLEDELAKLKKERSKSFIGLPVTSVALILPIIILFRDLTGEFFPLVWGISLIIIASLFLLKASFINKPDDKRMIIYIIIGVLEITAIGLVIWLATR